MSGQMHVTCVYPEVDRQNKQRRALSPIRDRLLSFQAQRMCLACFAFLFFKFDKRNNLAVAVTNLLTLIPLLIRLWTSFKYLNIKQACLTGLKVFLDLSSCSTGPKKNLDLSSCSNGTPIAHLRAFAYTVQPIRLINTTCSFLFLFISRFLCGSLNNPWTSCWWRAWGEKKVKWIFLFETICWNTTRNVSHVPYLSTVMGVTGSFPLQRSAWKHSFIKASWLEHDPEPHINTKLGLILLTLIVLNTWMFFFFLF